ncbi:MAG: hypothetical protein QOF37_456 [Thermoleophilaceae bacterium]|nr:hypothetical protein [Thermoleophilaceae bacterium]
MGGDYTRFTFNPRRDHAGVLLQQGRVQLDADLNELVEIVDRHERAQMYDLVGRTGVPRLSTPDGFKVRLEGGKYTIGRGRIYVDGIQVDNHGVDTLELDDPLYELRGSKNTPVDQQPYLGSAKPNKELDGKGPHLVYLDVWRREVTAVEYPDMVEKAVGVDTSTRVQTAWQVRVLKKLPAGTRCAGEWDKLSQWRQATRRSAARLTTHASQPQQPADPCLVGTTGGYRGRENRLYRVEVHDDGTQTGRPLTLKWSRDNASVAARVTGVDGTGKVLSVERVGRDKVMRFATDQWVEVTDDEREFDGRPGVAARVKTTSDVDSTVTLYNALSGVNMARNPRIRRWDQTQNLTAEGLIQPSSLPATIDLEDGIRVELRLAAGGGKARVGDYWVFAARTVDASVEPLTEAPPRGIDHHYTRLAVVSSTGIESCRVLFPPEPVNDSCDCTVCVTPEQQRTDPEALQQAIQKVRAEGGKVCLQAGVYPLKRPLTIRGARSIRLIGKGYKTVLLHAGTGPAVVIEQSRDVALSDVSVVCGRGVSGTGGGGSGLPDIGIAIANAIRTRIDRCVVVQDLVLLARGFLGGGGAEGPVVSRGLEGLTFTGGLAIGLAGIVSDTAVRDCVLAGEIGIGGLTAGRSTKPAGRAQNRVVEYQKVEAARRYLITLRLVIEANVMACLRAGVDFGSIDRRQVYAKNTSNLTSVTAHLGETRIASNEVYGCAEAGIVALGRVVNVESPAKTAAGPTVTALTFPLQGRLDVRGNMLAVSGHGIVVLGDTTRVADNDVTGLLTGGQSGILVNPGASIAGIRGCVVSGNRVRRMPGGPGIALLGRADDVRIAGNTVQEVGEGGIVAGYWGPALDIAVTGNEVTDVAAGGNGSLTAGIAVYGAQSADVHENVVRRVAVDSADDVERVGIHAVACRQVRITGNQVHDLAPSEDFGGTAKGIEIVGEWDRADVLDNSVQAPEDSAETSRWYALTIGSVLETERLAGEVLTQRSYRVKGDATDAQRSIANNLRGFTKGSPVLVVPTRKGEVFVINEWSVEPFVPGRSITAVSGNLLDARGRTESVLVTTPGNLSFQDNRCLLSASETSAPVGRLMADGAVIVNANHVEGPGRVQVALDIIAGAPSADQQAHCTVLGNIATGLIELNGQALQSPWDVLNLST